MAASQATCRIFSFLWASFSDLQRMILCMVDGKAQRDPKKFLAKPLYLGSFYSLTPL
jgi:hypothetical protein